MLQPCVSERSLLLFYPRPLLFLIGGLLQQRVHRPPLRVGAKGSATKEEEQTMSRNKSRDNRLRRMSLFAVFAAAVLLLAVRAGAAPNNVHSPIVIHSDEDFTNCACVTSGAGTTGSPFIIGPWSINNVVGDGVFIDGTNLTKSFVLWNLTVAGNSGSTQRGIALQNINPTGTQNIVAEVKGTQTSIQSANIGILVEFSSYVTLDGGGENPNGAGIGNTAGTINKHLSGAVDIESSSHITVKGWQLSANGGDHQPDWITLDPAVNFWGVGGVRMFGVSDSLIDHNAVNNCTDVSFSLFNSSHNTLTNNTADYPFTTNFVLTDGSAYNVLNGNVGGTADFIGYLVADPLPGTVTLAAFGPTHDNTLTDNISHSDGPTGNEVKAGIVPSFIGGFVVLNGTYGNQIINNQSWSSTAVPDFAWAQAVPNSGTPIGVDIAPPVLGCNVTASEGGGGVGNLNGNIWTGNAFHTIDSCLPPQ
jgi:parallel beta-helix repeat protein